MTDIAATAFVRATVASRVRTLDVVLCTLVVVAACAIGWFAASAAGGLVPAQNAMFDADTGRVLGNLTGASENYYRLKVHPWQGWVCAVYQQILARLFVTAVAVPLLNVTIAASGAGLLYAVLRRLDIGPWTAASHALLFCSTAAFVFWSTLPETHMVGGVSPLIAVLLLSGGGERRSIIAMAVSFSMVVTNAMVWVLQKIDFEALRLGWKRFAHVNLGRARRLMRPAVCSFGLVFVVWAPQWLFLHKRLGIPFNFLEERHFVEVGAKSWNLSLHVFGVLPPGSPAALVAAFACLGVLVAALRVLPRTQWFIPLFPLFGVVLHAIYGSESAFLFAPNYLPLFMVALALVMKAALPKWSGAVVLPVAALLLVLNVNAWNTSLQHLETTGQMRTYDTAVRY
jgi:hypothetical protein